MTPVTLRQLFYQLVSRLLIPNKQQAYSRLSSLTAERRRQGEFPELMDANRKIHRHAFWGSPAEVLKDVTSQYRLDRTAGLVPTAYTVRALHGVTQVAMDWEGIHLYQFRLRAARYDSWELSASSPDVTLAALQLRKGTRFSYEYDLNVPWRHEVRIEDRLSPEAGKTYPVCTGGGGGCPPEDCGGPADFVARRDEMLSLGALEDLATMAESIGQVALKRRPEIRDDEETRCPR
jgi:Plasmid pRiA4b ORF-3-like protein